MNTNKYFELAKNASKLSDYKKNKSNATIL